MMGGGLALEAGRRYADRRGRAWSCVAIVPVAAGAAVAVCLDDYGHAAIYRTDGRPQGVSARTWIDLVHEQ